MYAVFAFCDIRKFTNATEILQENVLRFVNLIGHIVHSNTVFFSGAPNKNIGDAFLLVWKVGVGWYTERTPVDLGWTRKAAQPTRRSAIVDPPTRPVSL